MFNVRVKGRSYPPAFWGFDGGKIHLVDEPLSLCGHMGNYIAIARGEEDPPEMACKNCVRIWKKQYSVRGA